MYICTALYCMYACLTYTVCLYVLNVCMYVCTIYLCVYVCTMYGSYIGRLVSTQSVRLPPDISSITIHTSSYQQLVD